MPPAYLRSPSEPKVEAKPQVHLSGCTTKEPKTKKQAFATQRRRGGSAYRCPHCTQWHHSSMLRAAG